jgi:hypothetical protein
VDVLGFDPKEEVGDVLEASEPFDELQHHRGEHGMFRTKEERDEVIEVIVGRPPEKISRIGNGVAASGSFSELKHPRGLSGKWEKARVVGYYHLPHASLASENPEAYRNALLGAPEGAGTCAHCGTGILHNVVVETEDGLRHCIGTECAQKVGNPTMERLVRDRMTSSQLDEEERRFKLSQEKEEARLKPFKDWMSGQIKDEDVVKVLQFLKVAGWPEGALYGNAFYQSLHHELSNSGSLTHRQAECAIKGLLGRETKKNATDWERIYQAITRKFK